MSQTSMIDAAPALYDACRIALAELLAVEKHDGFAVSTRAAIVRLESALELAGGGEHD